ncbi:MAG TPA: MIP/aquaporin family protein [Chthoniobacterales bacterium]|jgi:glycerol uptake facilitator protein
MENIVEGITATSKAVSSRRTAPWDWMVGEFFGTFLLVFFGCGSVHAAVLMGAQVGVFQIAIVWGLGIATAIYLTGALSGAHLNPAVTLSMAVWSTFPKKRVIPYVIFQMLGAFLACAVLFGIFGDSLKVYEATNGIIRGQAGSEATAMVYGEYFPNPGGKPLDEAARLKMSMPAAFFAEFIATAILLLVIFCVTDERNKTRPQTLTPATIGLTVTLLISLIGPLTMACMNPARDFAPRLFSSVAGWGSIPFSVNGLGWLTVYIIAPLLGGLFGGGIYRFFFAPGYQET